MINFLLTEGGTKEHSKVCPKKTTKGQYFPVWLEQER